MIVASNRLPLAGGDEVAFAGCHQVKADACTMPEPSSLHPPAAHWPAHWPALGRRLAGAT